MLRITIEEAPGATTVALAGRLAGPWVDELQRSWEGLIATRNAGSIRFCLDGVTFIDDVGRALLRTFHSRGASLAGAGCMTRAIVEEITRVVPS
jgi:anti-anti-sigma regulatory factor